jgi:hypothetical protein
VQQRAILATIANESSAVSIGASRYDYIRIRQGSPVRG